MLHRVILFFILLAVLALPRRSLWLPGLASAAKITASPSNSANGESFSPQPSSPLTVSGNSNPTTSVSLSLAADLPRGAGSFNLPAKGAVTQLPFPQVAVYVTSATTGTIDIGTIDVTASHAEGAWKSYTLEIPASIQVQSISMRNQSSSFYAGSGIYVQSISFGSNTFMAEQAVYQIGKQTGTISSSIAVQSSGQLTWVVPSTAAVNGECSSINETEATTAPTGTLCSAGTATTVTGTGPWNWSCAGAHGGTDASCTELAKIDGRCGASNNLSLSALPAASLCSDGSASGVTGTGPWYWSCIGSSSGAVATCSASLVTNGQCGTANAYLADDRAYDRPVRQGIGIGCHRHRSLELELRRHQQRQDCRLLCHSEGQWPVRRCEHRFLYFPRRHRTCAPLARRQASPALAPGTGLAPAPITARLPAVLQKCSRMASAVRPTTLSFLRHRLSACVLSERRRALPATGPWSWSCGGTGGGLAAGCSANLIVNGQCGTANNTSQSSAPTTNLCSAGSASSVTGSGPWTWSCLSGNGGTTASCSESLPALSLRVFRQSFRRWQ